MKIGTFFWVFNSCANCNKETQIEMRDGAVENFPGGVIVGAAEDLSPEEVLAFGTSEVGQHLFVQLFLADADIGPWIRHLVERDWKVWWVFSLEKVNSWKLELDPNRSNCHAKERTKQLRAETGPNRTHFSFTGLYEIKFFEGKNEETLVAKLFKSNLNSRSLNYSLLLRSDSVFVGFSLRYFAVVALLNFVCYLHHGNLCKHALNLSKGIDDGNGKLVLGGCDTILDLFPIHTDLLFLLICAVWILQHIKLVRRTYWCRLFIRLAIITGRGRWRYSASATLPLQW